MIELLGAAFVLGARKNGFYSKRNLAILACYKPLSVARALFHTVIIVLYLVLVLVSAHAPSSRYNTAHSHKH